MTEEARKPAEIHISEIDQFLAGRILDEGIAPRGFKVSMKDSDGAIAITEIPVSSVEVSDQGIDFELSPSEYMSLHDTRIEDYVNRPVHTSSAYEFFDFLFTHFTSFDCVVEFTGNAWKMTIITALSESA